MKSATPGEAEGVGRGADRQEAIGNNPKMLPADLRNHDLPGYLYVRGAPPCVVRATTSCRRSAWVVG